MLPGCARRVRRRIDSITATGILTKDPSINNIRDLAEALGWPKERVRAALPTRLRSMLSNAKPKSASGSEWSNDNVTAILEAASETQDGLHEERTLTAEQSDHVKGDLGGLSHATLAKVFGSWSEALAASGLYSRVGKPKRSKYRDERLWDYVVRYVSDPTVETVTFYGTTCGE